MPSSDETTTSASEAGEKFINIFENVDRPEDASEESFATVLAVLVLLAILFGIGIVIASCVFCICKCNSRIKKCKGQPKDCEGPQTTQSSEE